MNTHQHITGMAITRGLTLALLLPIACRSTEFTVGGASPTSAAIERAPGDAAAPRDGHADDGERGNASDAPALRDARGGIAVSGDLSFGAVDCGGHASPGTIMVSNASDSSVTFAASLERSMTSPYSIAPSTQAIAPHATATITVTPLPIPQTSATPGNYADRVTVTTDAAGDTPHVVELSEVAQGSILAFDTANIPFGDVPVATAQSTNFHVVNSGTLPATVQLGLTGSTTSSSFSVTPGGSQTVSSGVNLTAVATFSPGSSGGQTGAIGLTAASNTVLCAPLPAPLVVTGIGETGGLTVSTDALSFGATDCGTTAVPQPLTLTNSGNSPVAWSLLLSNTSPSPYTVGPATTGSLAPGATVTLSVAPGPIPARSSVQPGFYADTITINTDVVGDQPHVVTLSQSASGAVLAFSPSTLAFGGVPVGTTSTLPFQVINTGTAPAHVSMTSSSARFGVTGPGSTLAGGADESFSGAFSPGTSATKQSGTITMSTDPSDVLCAPLPAPLPVSGTGTTGVVAFSPSALTFGNQAASGFTACGTQAAAQPLTFTNAGAQDYAISATLAAGQASPYTFTVSPPSGLVAANGGTATILVTPNAIPQTSDVPGAYGDTLHVTTTTAGDTAHDIQLAQSAFGAVVSAPPSAVSFPATPVGTQSTARIGITNDGNAPATLSWTSITDPAFTFDSNVSLPPGGVTTNSNAYFAPTGAMDYTATSVMAVSAATILCAQISSPTVTLTGTGTTGPLVTVTPDPVDFNMVACGTAGGTRTITIKNSSLAAITWNAELTSGANFTVAPVSGSLAGGASVDLTITADPIPVSPMTTTAANAFGDTLTVTTSAPGDAPHAIPVRETASGAILAWQPASLTLPVSQRGQPVAFKVANTGNLQATVTVALDNPGPATLMLDDPASGTTSSGAPFTGSITESTASAPSTNATLTLTPAAMTVLCQPAPAALSITAD